MDDLPPQELPREGLGPEASGSPPARESVSGLSRGRRSLDPGAWLSRQLRRVPSRIGRRAVGLFLAIAMVLGFSGAAPLPDGPISGESASPAVAAGTSGASPGLSRTPSIGVSGSPAPQGPTPIPTAPAIGSQTAPTAAISFLNLMLDSSTEGGGRTRTFSFVTDGPGLVSAQIVTASPAESTSLCLAAEGSKPECASGATPGFTRPTAAVHSRWTVTLVSADEGTPTVDVAFSWPADHPSIRLSGGCFQGYPNPDSLRSLNASFKPRAAGQVNLTAAWPPAVVEASLTLADVTNATAVTVDTASYPAAGSIAGTYSHPVAAGRTYTITLFDAGADKGRPSLSATIAFP